MECLYERVSDGRFCERTRLIEWDASALLERGKFLPLLHAWTTKKFMCTANFAVSPSTSSLAVVSPDGELNVMQVQEDKLALKSQVRVLLDPYPELRLIEWNATETLLFATRSTAIIDVFEGTGMFLYKIPMKEESQGTSQIISQIRTRKIDNDVNFCDDVYALQIDGALSAFKVGKQAYHRLFNVSLKAAPLCAMAYSPRYNIIITSGEFPRHNAPIEGGDSSQFGVSVHRLTSGAPYVDCLKATSSKKAWHERIPFISDRRAAIISMEVSPSEKSLLAVTSAGDVLWFALPSLRLLRSVSALDENKTPTQIAWLAEDRIAVLHSTGQITKAIPENYFDGVAINQELNRLENCKRIRACAVDATTTFAITEVRLDSIVSPEENKQRVGAELSLFVLFHFTFVLRLLKALFSYAFGSDPTVDLNEKLGVEQSAHLALYATRTLTLAEYIQKCLADRKYELAISLAKSSKGAYNLDTIYKRQWGDLKAAEALKIEHVDVLRCVHDRDWVIEECLRLKVEDVEMHSRLLSLAQTIIDGATNERLASRVHNAAQILHVARAALTHDSDICAMYLRYRALSLVSFAFALAEEAHIETLAQLLCSHTHELRNYRLALLAAIPETVRPQVYAHLLPFSQVACIWTVRKAVLFSERSKVANNGADAFVLSETDDRDEAVQLDELPSLHVKNASYLLGIEGNDNTQVMRMWCEERARSIDLVAGVTHDCVQLLQIAQEHGFMDLEELCRQYRLYDVLVRFSVSVSISFKNFLESDAASVQLAIAKHIKRQELMDNFEQIVQIIEFTDHDRGKAAENIFALVTAHCARNFEALDTLYKVRPQLLTSDALVECFKRSELTGERLVDEMRRFRLDPNLIVVVGLCACVGELAELTFADVYAASRDAARGRDLLRRFVHGSCASASRRGGVLSAVADEDWWRDLLSRAHQLRGVVLTALVTEEDMLRLVADEMLECTCRDVAANLPPARRAPFHLLVHFDAEAKVAPTDTLHFGYHIHSALDEFAFSVFEELIVAKSRAFLEAATCDLKDANLRRAALVLDIASSDERQSRALSAQRRAIEVVRQSLEMGSRRLPAMFAVCDPEVLFAEAVSIKTNYKNVKESADLARLLNLSSPSARALASCASTALDRQDMATLRNFARQLAKSARNLSFVFETAKLIFEAGIQEDDVELKDDVLACIVQNCPEDQLTALFKILARYRQSKQEYEDALNE